GGGSLANLTLRSGGLAGYAVGNANSATISADTVRIDNAIGGAFSGSPSGVGNLLVNARQITVGAGDNQKIQGFGSVAMNASESFVGDRTGKLDVTGNLAITASRITGTTGSNQSISSALAVSVAQPATPTLPASALAAGAQLSFTGATLTDNARIDLPSGKLTLTAKGDLTLGSVALVNASSYSKSFGDITASAPAGTVSLSSSTGNVLVNPGAVVDVSPPPGGDAGTISVSAISGTLQLQGSLLGNATAGNTGGAFQADAGSLANFSALIANTAAGGFTGAQSYRARSGDITVGAA